MTTMGRLWHQVGWLPFAMLSARVLAVPSDPIITPGPKLVRRENAIVGYSSDPLSGCELIPDQRNTLQVLMDDRGAAQLQ